ncbi:MAG: HAMP domain-containing sensor histidine kinase [Vicinamibacterales bacterium]
MLAAKLQEAQRVLAGQWLNQLNEILPVDKLEVFPGDQMLDHIPDLIEQIAGYLRAPEHEAIAANTAVMAKAAELGQLRYEQQASVHQLLREYNLLGTLLEQFITSEVAKMGTETQVVGALQALGRVSQAVRVLQQQTIDTFVGKYAETIERQTAQLRGFSRLITHEIRQPLNVLQLVTRMLPAGVPPNQAVVEMLARNVRQVSEIAGKLERFTLASDDEDSPAEQEVDLSALCADVERQLQDMAAARGVKIIVDADLPRFVTDSGRAELAIVNLIANAIKYSDPDKAERFVRIRCVPGPAPAIVVEDNGIGIPQNKLTAIFRQFIRAHADRDDELGAQGLGLGLAIVRECMDAMEGTVTVESKEREGAAFTLTWPARD